MRHYLSDRCVLKWLEEPSVYDIENDELYEVDDSAFAFLQGCASDEGCDGTQADSSFIDDCLSEGILTERRVAVRRPHLLKSPVPSLRYLELQVTTKCNLRCRHCYIGKPSDRELPVDSLRRVLREFEEMQGLRLLITGGEPLLHSSFQEFNDDLPFYAFRKVLFTNGLLLRKNLIRGLNVDEIQFSVDGMEHGHEALRGKGTYGKVMDRIGDTLSEGMSVSVATMVHQENLEEFDRMDLLFRGMGIRDWTVDVPCVSGSFAENALLQVPPEIAGPYFSYGFGGGLHGGGKGYGCGLHLASVLADGTVAKCAFYGDKPAGKVSGGLRAAWGRVRPVRLDELECARISCGAIDVCRGGCRFRAETSLGQGRRDPFKCAAYGQQGCPE
ncbi:MAG TPA: radical SAM protein [Dissulfurispiraceae bacterium]|nr:radical SAM protein [Dissulfurispiraceae bacterium]